MNRTALLLLLAQVFLCPLLMARSIQVPAQFPKIQQAIAAALSRDTVIVAPGTYIENIDFLGKEIVVGSRFLTDKNFNHIRNTIIDGSNPTHPDSGSVVRFGNGEDSLSLLVGFTLTKGIGSLIPGAFMGGGIIVRNSSSPRIEYNIIRNNSATQGGGLGIRNSYPKLKCNAIVTNSATRGGGIYQESGLSEVQHNIFYDNAADIAGGALYIKGGFANFVNNAVYGNRSATGGGLYCEGGLWFIEYSNFFNNTGGDFSGCGADLGDSTWGVNFNFDPVDKFFNLFRSPSFVDPPTYNFALACSSPLIDAGPAKPETFPLGGVREDIGMVEYSYRVGDANLNNSVNIVDASVMINMIFFNTPLPCPIHVTDADCSRNFNISDIVALIQYLFYGLKTDCLPQ